MCNEKSSENRGRIRRDRIWDLRVFKNRQFGRFYRARYYRLDSRLRRDRPVVIDSLCSVFYASTSVRSIHRIIDRQGRPPPLYCSVEFSFSLPILFLCSIRNKIDVNARLSLFLTQPLLPPPLSLCFVKNTFLSCPVYVSRKKTCSQKSLDRGVSLADLTSSIGAIPAVISSRDRRSKRVLDRSWAD